jgi:hypothetical protein
MPAASSQAATTQAWPKSVVCRPRLGRLLIQPFLQYAVPGNNKHESTFNFPLAPDHRLITLVQYNVLRATLTNFALVSSLVAGRQLIPPECAAIHQIPPESLFVSPSSVPPSLEPTPLQLTTPHDPWIDAVPDPTMRDNLLRHIDIIDHDDLCRDVAGGLFEGFHEVEIRGLIAWTDPWSPRGWEVSDGFARKWGFLLQGCHDLVESTNRWRDMRGDDRLSLVV